MNIYYGGGSISLDTSFPVRCIEISFNGVVSIESSLPRSWVLMANSNKILGGNTKNTIPGKICTYEGKMYITSCKIIDNEGVLHFPRIRLKSVDYPERLNTNFEDFTQFPEEFSNDISYGKIPTKSTLKHINLHTERDEFTYEDGTMYMGDYHVHGNGQAMTGATHTDNSINIFRKSNNVTVPDMINATRSPELTRNTKRSY